MEAQAAVAAGAVILDVRRADEFEKRHIDGAVNIPLMGLAEAIQAPSSPSSSATTRRPRQAESRGGS